MKDRVGIGVIGFAHGHAALYCQAMSSTPDVTLVSGWDDDRARGEEACARFGMAFCADARAVLDDPRVDAVIITTETNRHADDVELAAAAGKAILLQKPMATTLADCGRIAAAVQRSGVKFSMAYQMRYDPVNLKIKELVDAGAVGRIAVVRRRHSLNVLLNPAFVNGPTRWHFDPVANVGMFFDDASHPADWFHWLLGRPISVIAEIDRVVTNAAPDDNGIAVYRFAGGEMGEILNSSTTVAAACTTEIYGTEGTIQQDYGDAPSTSAPRPVGAAPLRMIRTGETAWTEFRLPVPASQGERIMAVPRPFVDYVRGLTEETVTAEDGRVAVEMVLGAYQSAREGRRVSFAA
jgi:predicted dehydrogenase